VMTGVLPSAGGYGEAGFPSVIKPLGSVMSPEGGFQAAGGTSGAYKRYFTASRGNP
jgi:hypothetical protein